jgi:heavy metal sensor kinase
MSWKIGVKFYRRTDFKLTLWYILTFLVSTLIICGFLYLRLRHQLIKEIDQFLLDETTELERVLSQKPEEVHFLIRFEDEVMVRKYYPFFFQILNQEGKPLYISKKFGELEYVVHDEVLANAKKGSETRERFVSPKRRTPYRIISTPVYKNGTLHEIIQVGTHLHFLRKNLVHFRNNILVAAMIVLVLGALGGWALARKSLSPIGYIASKAQSITSENLSERLEVRGTDDEMDNLVKTINEMIARLEGSFRRMAEFTADVSHELKTPICAMRGEAEVLISKARSQEDYQEGLAHFIERFDYLNRMINDLVFLSKSDFSQEELKMSPLRLDLLIQDLYHLFKVIAEQKGIDMSLEDMEGVLVKGDKVRLQQLFTNLIDNAIKFTPEKGSIRLSLKKDEDEAMVRIMDTGMGISKGEQENIFKRFYRVDKSRSKETGGVGLGLSIAQWIAQAHHGKIKVDSALNRGSTFTVYLPIMKT